ncbi:uncharacterized protein L201_001336 [Kwoniella dendrophila CBS 6074]|uniref:DNA polymerase epsilon subunit D n=1 Tax=Kwoniella dendrophila CBS 6074 TaxID=1295534 RepID=A0AAX4JM34_9TREE
MPPKQGTLQPQITKQTPIQSASFQQQKANSVGIGEYELPKSNITKLAKGSLPDNVKMQHDVVLALLRGSTLFINYLSSAAHDVALDRSGRTITAADVIKAITELDFGPSDALVPLLEQELQAYRNHVQAAKLAKKSASASTGGRGKAGRKSTGTVNDGDVEMVDDDEEAEDNENGEEGGEEDEEGEGENNGAAGDESEVQEAAEGEGEDGQDEIDQDV